MPKLTETERAIVEHLYAHRALSEDLSLAGLAAECHVAKSTIIKTLQKLGFSGFQDYLYAYQTRSSVNSDNVLPERVVEGDLAEAAETLADCLERCEGRYNVCHSGIESEAAPIAEHLSRKLNMLGLTSTTSYDYATFDAHASHAGVMFFLFERLPKQAEALSNVSEPALESLVSYASGRGFTTVGFIDADSPLVLPSLDVGIRLAATYDGPVNLFAVKVLMLFEEALATYSARLAAAGRAGVPSRGDEGAPDAARRAEVGA